MVIDILGVSALISLHANVVCSDFLVFAYFRQSLNFSRNCIKMPITGIAVLLQRR